MHVPETIAELLEALESLNGEVLTTRSGEVFPVGIWAMQASNIIRQQQFFISTKCYRPIQMGVKKQ